MILILLLSVTGHVFGQSKEELEKERMRIIEQIEKTSTLLDKTSESRESTLTDLKLIQDQIENRKKVMENIRNSIELLEADLTRKNIRQGELSINYFKHQQDHARLLRMSYLKMLTENKLVYLLSSKDWEESLNRWRYSSMIEDYLNEQIDTLNRTTVQLDSSILRIESDRELYENLLKIEEENYRKLELDEKRKDNMLAQLKGDEMRLKGALIKQRQDREKLNKAIEDIILASLNKDKNKGGGEDFGLAGEFGQLKGELPWPVNNPRVISKYGKQKHPTLDNVFISNNGVDIFSQKKAAVRAIFKGEVAGALQIPGNDFMIMVRHGNFYTVYSKLDEVYVSKGDRIAAGHTLGRLGPNNAILHFEVWQDKQKLNPEHWLR